MLLTHDCNQLQRGSLPSDLPPGLRLGLGATHFGAESSGTVHPCESAGPDRYAKFGTEDLTVAAARIERGRDKNVIEMSRFGHSKEPKRASG